MAFVRGVERQILFRGWGGGGWGVFFVACGGGVGGGGWVWVSFFFFKRLRFLSFMYFFSFLLFLYPVLDFSEVSKYRDRSRRFNLNRVSGHATTEEDPTSCRCKQGRGVGGWRDFLDLFILDSGSRGCGF